MTWKERFDKTWTDPVWSKVISGVILTIGGTILFYLKDFIISIPFKSGAYGIKTYLLSQSLVYNYAILLLVLVVFAVSLLSLFRILSLWKVLISKINSKPEKTKSRDYDYNELPYANDEPINFFAGRMANTFPGLRGGKWYYNEDEISDRLVRLLRFPLVFKNKIDGVDNGTRVYLSWFRGHSFNYIKSFRKISNKRLCFGKSRFLMNEQEELVISKIFAYQSNRPYHNFVYVECNPDKQTGLYNFTEENLKDHVETFGYSWEEYGLLDGTPIRREHYDDGATEIKGKVTDAYQAELRVRYLSKYNFIIGFIDTPFNEQPFEDLMDFYLDKIMNDESQMDSFVEKVEKLPKRYSRY